MRGPITGRATSRRAAAPVPAVLLVLAKAPVPGRAKTRLTPPLTPEEAADVAAAALLDTLAAVAATPGTVPVVAWTGDLTRARRRDELERALAATTRVEQRGAGLGERIAAAHADAAAHHPGRPLLQIGMDTPQLGPADLTAALAPLRDPAGPDAVLGPAEDGGWWGLGLRDPGHAALITEVPTSRDDTGERTLRALRAAGLRVDELTVHRDVDTVADARAVAAAGAGPRFTATVEALLTGAAR